MSGPLTGGIAFANGNSLGRFFNGTSDFCQNTGLGTTATTNISFSVWYYLTGTQNFQPPIYFGASSVNGYGLFAYAGGDIKLFLGGVSTIDTTVAAIVGAWANVIVTQTSGIGWNVYLNGSHIYGPDNTAAVTPTTGGAGGSQLGQAVANSNFLNGYISDAAIWTTVLTATNIFNIANGVFRPNNVQSGSLVGYWPITGASPEPDSSSSALNLAVTSNQKLLVAGPLSSRVFSGIALPQHKSGQTQVFNFLYPGAVQPKPTAQAGGTAVLSYTNAFPGIAFPQHKSGQSTVQSFMYPGAVQPAIAVAPVTQFLMPQILL